MNVLSFVRDLLVCKSHFLESVQEMLSLAQVHWTPGIGDNTFVGFFTVAAYFSSSILCITYAVRMGRMPLSDQFVLQRRLWWGIAILLLLLGINKQLDLQTLITVVGRELAKQQGWYEKRRTIQVWFIVLVAGTGFFTLIFVGRVMHGMWQKNWLALVGLVILVCFILIRAASFHKIDRMLSWNLEGLKINWILELGGITCVGIAAAINLCRCTKKGSEGNQGV
jgi:hypothetical protein